MLLRRPLVAVALLCLAPALSLAHDGPHPLSGTLVERHSDALDGGEPATEYHLRTTTGRELALEDDQRDRLVGQRVSVVDAEPEPGVQGRAAAADSTRSAGPTSLGPHRVAVIMLNFTNNRSTPVTADALRSTVFTGAGSVNAYYQSQSGGAVSLVGRDRPDGDVYGWYELPIASGTCDVDAYAASARAMAVAQGVDLSGYDHVVYYFPTVGACGFGGLGELPGSESWVNGYNQVGLIAHELGHNMGVHHAATIGCRSGGAPVPISDSCDYVEYGDPFDVMGNGSRLMSSWHRAQLGQLPSARQTTVTRSDTYSLGTVNDVAAATSKLILVPRRRAGKPTTEFYALEIRSTLAPFDNWSASAPAVVGVSVRLVPALTQRTQSRLVDASPLTGSFNDAPLQSGGILSDDAYGITIQNLGSTAGSASLRITVPALADTTPPTQPGLRATIAGSVAELRWSASTDDEGLARYEVFRNDVLLASTESTGFDDTGFGGLTSAVYRVDAVDAAGNRTASGSIPLSLPDTVAPSAVGGLTATRSGTSVTLGWSPASDDRGVAGYVVARDGSRIGGAGLGLVDSSAGSGARTYEVRAVDAAGNEGAASVARVEAIPGSTPPKSAPSARIVLSSPRLRSNKARVPRSGRLVLDANRATRMSLRLGSKTVRSTRGSRLRYTLPQKYRKRSSTTLTVTATVSGRRYTVRYTVRKGVIRKR